MQDKNNPGEDFNVGASSANKGQGSESIDKPLGEESSRENARFAQETQKGKKVDRDPSHPEEEPLDNQDI